MSSNTTNRITTGPIACVQDCGTIVIVSIRTSEGWLAPVLFDHSSFRWLLHGQGCQVEDLIGRIVEYEGSNLIFLDVEE